MPDYLPVGMTEAGEAPPILEGWADGRYLQAGTAVEISDETIAAAIDDPDSDTRAELDGAIATAPPVLAPRARVRQIVPSIVPTAMQSGHAWTVSGTLTTSNLNNTSDFCRGSQAATLTTSSAAYGFLLSPNPVSPTIDLTARALRLWVKVSDPTKIAELTFWAASGGSFATTYSWDLTTYIGGIDFIQPNEWTPLTLHVGLATVTGSPVRTALNRFKFQVKDNGTGTFSFGFNGFDVIPDSTATYPNGVATLTFDDTWLTQFTVAKPLMDLYGFAGTCYIITGNVGTTDRMSLAQLRTLQEQGWEIATHAATQALHDSHYGALDVDTITEEIHTAKSWLMENGFRSGDHFAYPGGHCEGNVRPTVQGYFSSARLVYGQNAETFPPADASRIRSMQPSSSTATGAITARIDAAIAGKAWIPLAFHDFVTSGATGVQYTAANFATVLAYLKSSGIAVRTMGQVLAGE